MAPKAKAPAKAAAKQGAKKAPKEYRTAGPSKNPVLLRNQIIILICVAIVCLALISMVMNISDFFKRTAQEEEFIEPFNRIKDTLDDERHRTKEPKGVTDVILKKVDDFQMNRRLYPDIRGQYQFLFTSEWQNLRYFSGPWQLMGDNRYYISREDQTWFNAETFCVSIGGHLASILNTEEQNFITSQITKAAWIGLKYRAGMVRWSDGNTVLKEFRAAAEDQPMKSLLHENCFLLLRALGRNNWIERDCYRRFRWVCKGTSKAQQNNVLQIN